MNMKKSQGFTMLELLVVLAILGVIAAIVLPTAYSGTSSANSQLKMRVAETFKTCVVNAHARLGWGSNILTNPNYESGNDALDVCIGGDVAVIAAQDNNFERVDVSGLSDMVQIKNPPTAGGKGEYYVGSSRVTLSSSQPTGQLSLEFANSADEEVCDLKAKYEGFSGTCDNSTADTTGVIQHTASSGGLVTLKILRKLAL